MLCQFKMAINKFPQNSKKTTQKQTRSEFLLRPLQGVGQDRSAPKRARAASPQPLTLRNGTVNSPLDKNSDRVQKNSIGRHTIMIGARVPKPIAQEVDRIAKETGKTRSQATAILLEEAVHQKLHLNHAVMLAPLVREMVTRSFQPLLPLILNVAYDISQARHITGIALSKMTRPEEMETIREKTAKKARETVLHHRPELAELIELTKTSIDEALAQVKELRC
jgi:hypothetical protein